MNDGPGPRRHANVRRGQGETLMPLVAEVMDESGLAFTDLQAIGVTTGPGGFTGIRIGLSAARGFALAAGLPVIGVTTLETVAAAQTDAYDHLLVVLDSKRDDLYVQLFGPGAAPQGEPRSLLPEDIGGILPAGEPVALAGDRAETVRQSLADRTPPPRRLNGPDLPDAAVVARIAAERYASRPVAADAPPPAALYLRPPDAIPFDGRR